MKTLKPFFIKQKEILKSFLIELLISNLIRENNTNRENYTNDEIGRCETIINAFEDLNKNEVDFLQANIPLIKIDDENLVLKLFLGKIKRNS